MDDVFSSCSDLLQSAVPRGMYYQQALEEYERLKATGEDMSNLSIAYLTDDIVDQLNHLKFRYIELCTKQMFLEKIAASQENSSPPYPTMQELASVELAAQQEKATLKKAKEAREETNRRLETTVRNVADLIVEEETAREAFSKRIESGKAGVRLQKVCDILERHDRAELHDLVVNISDHDSKACNRILSRVFNDLSEKQAAKENVEADVASLQAEIDHSIRRQAELEELLAQYRAEAKRHEERNADAPRLREEILRHERVYEVMTALTRASISSVHEQGICIEICVDRPAAAPPGEEGSPVEAHRYKLDMVVADTQEGFISKVSLTPGDVSVDDIATKDHPTPILRAVLRVRRRLSGCQAGKHS